MSVLIPRTVGFLPNFLRGVEIRAPDFLTLVIPRQEMYLQAPYTAWPSQLFILLTNFRYNYRLKLCNSRMPL